MNPINLYNYYNPHIFNKCKIPLWKKVKPKRNGVAVVGVIDSLIKLR